MITGSFNISEGANTPSFDICNSGENTGMTFYPVKSECFKGGYYLHPGLPITGRDIYFYDKEEDLIVLFSGYIYNRAELTGFSGCSETDPDPVIASRLFLSEGPDFVRKLNGDFAIFICQPGKRCAYLFRDQIGIRPLAWLVDRDMLIFSSDIMGLCRAVSNGKQPEREFLLGYFRYTDYFATPSGKVMRLKPGHYLYFSGSGIELSCYWSPGKLRTDNRLAYATMISDLHELLTDSVKIRCDKRFIAGAHVSSGLDSGIISILARKGYPAQRKFYGFSWSPANFSLTDIKYDERVLVLNLCQKADIEPLFCNMSTERFIDKVSGFMSNYGHFFEDHVTDQAIMTGTELIFSGWGGDEFISTGDRGIETDLLRGLHLKTYFKRNPIRPLKRFVKYFLLYTVFPTLGILQKGVVKSFERDTRYIKKSYRGSDRKALRNFYFHTSRRLMHLRYLEFYHLQERCESWILAGYRKGIEYRFPMLDRRIVEYMIKIPSVLLSRADYFRPVLRIIGEGILPEEIRLNTSKKDPVYSEQWDIYLKTSADKLLGETNQWRMNSALDFVDFDLLQADSEKYRDDPESIDQHVLFKALIYIKAMHEFSKWYCEK